MRANLTRMLRRLRRRILFPGSTPDSAAYRARMAASIPRLAGRTGEGSEALSRALRTTALGRLSSEERAWDARIEARRREFAAGEQTVPRGFSDGVGPADREGPNPSIPLSGASQWLSLTPVWCHFLMRLVRERKAHSCVELGTGFGVSGAYQAAALELNGAGLLTTLEGMPEYAAIAEQGFSSLGLGDHVDLRVGPIDETIGDAMEAARPIDCAFVDADHTEEATMRHFDAMLPHLSPGAVLVFDDVNWKQSGMTRAWRAIGRHERVSVSLTFERIGIVVCAESSRS
jgi:predicted O-methyltransferase YrrM